MKLNSLRVFTAIALCLLAFARPAVAQGTTFTYQGRLNASGAPATGNYDLRFGLYTANSGGSPVGALVTTPGVAVSGGLFSTTLDFGGVFSGTNYFLEIGVRPAGSSGAYTTLTPRQAITPEPYALFAPTAGTITGVLTTNNLPPNVALLNNANFTGTINGSALNLGSSNLIAPLTVTPRLPSAAVGSVTTLAQPLSLAVAGRYIAVVDANGNALQIIDASNPTAPVVVGVASTGTFPVAVAVAGRFAYVVDYTDGSLQVFDISNPASPVLLSTTAAGSQTYSVAVSGHYVYAANFGANTLQVFDVMNPVRPVAVGSVGTGAGPVSVAVAGRYAYVGNFTANSLQIFDLNNPANPALIGTVAASTGPSSVAVAGRYAIVGTTNALQIFDVKNPASPVLAGSIAATGGPRFAAIADRYVYVASENGTTNGLQLFDISNPASPVLLGSAPTGTSPAGVAVSGRYAYVVDYNNNLLQIFDMGGAYLQQLEAGSIETGSLQVRDSATVANSLNVRGGFTASGSARISGGLSVDNGRIIGDGSGLSNLVFTSTTSTAITNFTGALAGDVTGTQSATVVSTVGGVGAANVASGAAAANAATSANSPGTIVIRDSNGNFSAGNITGSFTGNGSGLANLPAANLTGIVPNSTLAGTYSSPLQLTNTNNVIAGTFNGNGAGLTNLNIAAGSVANFTGTLAGDVTGSQGATTVSKVGGISSIAVAMGSSAALGATSANTASKIVSRDGTGSFSAGTITAAFNGNGSGLTNLGAANLTGTVPQTALSGAYPAALQLTNTNNVIVGTFNGNGAGLTNLNIAAGSVANFTGPLAGDVTGSQGATTVSKVGGVSAIAVAMGSSAALGATSANTASKIVSRDATGSFAAGTVTASSFNGDGAGITNLNAANLTGIVPRGALSGIYSNALSLANTNNLIAGTFTGNGAGLTNLNVASSTVQNFSGALAGDVTGTQNATTIAKVGGVTAANIASAANAANAATSANTPGAIVTRDSSGNFVAGTVTGSFNGNGAGLGNLTAANLTGTIPPAAVGPASVANGQLANSSISVIAANGLTGSGPVALGGNITLGTTATDVNTPNAIVSRDGSGNFSAGTITGAFTGNGGGLTNVSTAALNGVLPQALLSGTYSNALSLTNTANVIAGTFTGNGAGLTNLNIATGSVANFTGSLAGDVTGTQGATVVGRVGGVTAANLASGANAANAATSASTPSTLVSRDSNGSFSAVNITGSFTGNGGGLTNITAGTATNFSGALAGDVTGTQGNTRVASVGGLSALGVSGGAGAALNATSFNLASTIVSRDAAGSFVASNVTAAFTGNGAAITNLNAANLTGSVPGGALAGVYSNALSLTNVTNIFAGTFTGSGAGLTGLSAVTATNFSGTLAGDVTGIQGATVVGRVGGVTAANVASGANAANGATSVNTPGTIVTRDSSGNFSAGTVTGSFTGNGGGLTNVNAVAATNFTGTLAGDVTGTQGATVVGRIAGISAVNVSAGVNAALGATPLNVASTIVSRDASGSLNAANINAANINATNFIGAFTGNGASITNLNATSLTGIVPRGALSGVYSNALSLTNSTNLIAGTFTGNGAALTGLNISTNTAAGFSGVLAGDVIGTQGATVVNTIGGVPSSVVATGAARASAAVSALQPNAIVARDGAGGFSAGAITAAFIGNGAGVTNIATSNLVGTIPTALIASSSANTPNTLVGRDGSGNFAANSISLNGTLNLPATSATNGVIFVGSNTLILSPGIENFFAGASAGNTAVVGSQNTGVGFSALKTVTSGSQNNASGNRTLANNLTGTANTADGFAALNANTTGNDNTLVGALAMSANTTGGENSGVGVSALSQNNGNYNSALGYFAGYANTTGSNNVFLGPFAGDSASGTASGQLIAGSDANPITNAYLGNGVIDATPLPFTVNATGGKGTDITGANLNLAGGAGTGRGAGGALVFLTAASNTVSGAGVNTPAERVRITGQGNVGIGKANPATALDVNGVVTASSFSGSGAGLTGINVVNATNFSGTLAGDVTGTQGATVVSKIGALPVAAVISGLNAAITATPSNVGGTIVSRDASGSFIAANVNATNFIGAFAGNGAGVTNLSATNLTGIVPRGALSGVYSNALSLTNTTNLIAGTFTGNGSGLTSLAASNLTGTVPIASIANASIGNAQLVNSSVSILPGNGLATGGVVPLGGSITLNTTGTSSNAPNAIVSRDGIGNFTANTVTLQGNLNLPATTSSAGAIFSAGQTLVHAFGNGNFYGGAGAGNFTMSGVENVGVGVNSLIANTTGSDNVAVGSAALNNNTTGSGNTGVGLGTLELNTSGNNNAAAGLFALGGNTTGTQNAALGANALSANTTGNQDTAVGFQSLAANSTAGNNTAIGADSAAAITDGAGNTASGANALFLNVHGSYNTANGYQALLATTSSFNTALGTLAGEFDTTGSNNIFLGFNAGDSANPAASGQLIAGSGNSPITSVFLGNGVSNAAPQGVTINATGGGGPNIPGANLSLAGGISTGQGNGGSVVFLTSPSAAVPGNGFNALTERMRVTAQGNVGIGKSNPASALDVNGVVTALSFVGDGSGLTNLPNSGGSNFSGTLAGDVTGTQKATVVSTVGGITAANVASGATAANGATSVLTPGTIVSRDVNGSFTAANITASFTGNGSGINNLTATNLIGVIPQTALSGTYSNALSLTNTANVIAGTFNGNAAGNFSGAFVGNFSGSGAGLTGVTSSGFTGALAGDVSGTQGATVVNKLGGVNATNVAQGATAANAATSANTASTIVARDASGNFTAGTITGTFAGNGFPLTNLNAANLSGIIPQAALSGTYSNVLSLTNAANTIAGTFTGNGAGLTGVTTSGNFSGALAGDVSGTQGATVVNKVGGLLASAVAGGASAANLATSASTPNTIVSRDVSGSFSAANITGAFTGNGFAITNLNATNLNGVIPQTALSGTYSNALSLTNTTNVIAGTFTGNGAGLTGVTTSGNFSGALAGDVSGTQAATVVNFVGGASAASVANAAHAVANAGSTGAPGSLVLLDGMGNFTANFINASFEGDGSGLVNLTAANLLGSIPNSALSGTYSSALQLTNVNNIIAGTFTGNFTQSGINLNSGSSSNAPFTVIPNATSAAISTFSTGAPGAAIAVYGRYLYFGDVPQVSLKIYDISNPGAPQQISISEIQAAPTVLTTDGNYVYVIDADLNLAIIDVTNPKHPQGLGRTQLNPTGFASSLAVAGDYLYVGGNDGEADIIYTVDISNPFFPSVVGASSFGLGASVLAKSGRYTFGVDNTDNTIGSFDVSDPTNPDFRGTAAVGTVPVALAVSGRYAYIANSGDNDFQIEDISDPTAPFLVSTGLTVGSPSSIVVADHYVYVGGGDSTSGFLQIFDVSNPVSPVSLGSRTTVGGAQSLTVSGRYAFLVSSNNAEIQIFDLGGAYLQQVEAGSIEVASVQVRDNLNLGGDLNVRGSLAATDARFGGNVGVRGNIMVSGIITADLINGSVNGAKIGGTLSPNALSGAYDQALQFTSVDNMFTGSFSGNGSGLTSLHYSSFEEPLPDSALSGTYSSQVTMVNPANVFGGTFIGTISQGGVNVNSGSGPALSVIPTPTNAAIATVPTDGPAAGVAVFGRYAYVADIQAQAVQIYDISDPTSPQLITEQELQVSPNVIATDGNFLYAADFNLNFEVIDVTDPTQPILYNRVQLNAEGFANSLSVAGHYAYVGGTDGTQDIVYIVDISDPSAPVLAGSTSFGSGVSFLAQDGRFVFGVDSSDNTIASVNVGAPTAPAVTGTASTGPNPAALAVSGRYAYLANSDSTLQIMDISNPQTPISVSVTPTTGTPSSVVVVDHFVYVIGSDNGDASGFLQVFDVTSPLKPVSLGSQVTASGPASLMVQGRYAFLTSSNDNSMQIFDLGGAYLQHLEAGAAELASVQVRDSVNVGNDLAVRGGLSAGDGRFTGNVGINGHATIGNAADGSPGFTLQVNGTVAGVGAYNNISDERYKKNITPLTHALDKIMNIEGVEYDWRTNEFPKINFDRGTQIGFIAQQLKEVLPEAVTQDTGGYYSIAYSKVIPVLVEAVKDQQKQIASKDAELAAMKHHDAEVEARLTALENALKTVAENKR